jgi:hypothetical protein
MLEKTTSYLWKLNAYVLKSRHKSKQKQSRFSWDRVLFAWQTKIDTVFEEDPAAIKKRHWSTRYQPH